MNIEEKWKQRMGGVATLSGRLFKKNQREKEREFTVHDVKTEAASFYNEEDGAFEIRTKIKLLLQDERMSRPMWTRWFVDDEEEPRKPFPSFQNEQKQAG